MVHVRALSLKACHSVAAARHIQDGVRDAVKHHGQPRILWVYGALPSDHARLLERLSRRWPSTWVMSSEPSTIQGTDGLLVVALWADQARLGLGAGQGLKESPERAFMIAWQQARQQLQTASFVALCSPHHVSGFIHDAGLSKSDLRTFSVEGASISPVQTGDVIPRYLGGIPIHDAAMLALVDTSRPLPSGGLRGSSEAPFKAAFNDDAEVTEGLTDWLAFRLRPHDLPEPLPTAPSASDERTAGGGISIATIAANAPADIARLKTLVVEDDPVTRFLLGRMLRHKGVSCDVAQDGRQGLEMASQNPYDAIVTDCHLPGLDGVALARRLRESGGLNATTPIFAMTANAPAMARQACLDAGMEEVFGKPLDAEVLANALAFWSLDTTQ